MKLLNCDSIEYMKSLPSESIDLIVTDPPYRIDHYGTTTMMGGMMKSDLTAQGKIFRNNDVDVNDYAKEFSRLLKQDTHCYVMTNDYNLRNFLNAFAETDLKFVSALIWDKKNKIINCYYMKQFEYILFFKKGKYRKISDLGISNILSIPNIKTKDKVNGGNLHDTEKPVELMEILVTQSSQEGETVLDPFMGIGSTGIACVKNNRNFIGCEIDYKYYNIAVDRINEEKNKLRLF